MSLSVCLQGVSKQGPDGRSILSGVDLALEPGAWSAVMGPSGGGKTTLLSIVAGLDGSFEGSALVFGTELREASDEVRTQLRRRRIGFVHQSFHLLESWTVGENVSAPLWLEGRNVGDEVRSILERVGMAERVDDGVKGLSGGERQRVAIARALVHRPGLLIADEPTGNLDDGTSTSILDLVEALRADQPELAVLMATHDPRVSGRADTVLRLEKGVLG
ncbi:MAG: ATP-binding cassette domain-containing protein [Myxococcota bacterium]